MRQSVLILPKIKIHSLTLLLIILSIISARIGELAITLLVVIGHELGHACMASFFKWKINQINILPFGGELDTDNFGTSPIREEVLVVIAGPLFNVVIAGMLLLLTDSSIGYYLDFFIKINLVILLANLLPIWPLDGGKLLNILLSSFCSFREAHIKTLIISIFILISLSVGFIVLNVKILNGWIFIAFLIFAIWRGFKQKEFLFYRFLLSKKGDTRVFILEVDPDETVIDVAKKLRKGVSCKIRIVKKDVFVGEIDEDVLINLLLEKKMFNAEIGSCIL